MPLLVSLLFSFFYFLFPGDAVAWGPITHIDFASEALAHLAIYGPAVKALLGKFPLDFLYGALAADITIGKDYVDYVYNCHNWRVGFVILNEARDDRQKAAAFGYLSHLAVDIIAHNYFIPFKVLFSYPTRTLGHVYWEMRFDAKRPKKIWDLAKKVSGMRFPHNDELFGRMLKRTLFSFKTNKRIFRSVLTLHKFRHWKTMMEKVHDVSRFKLHPRDIEEYRLLAIDSVVTFLKDPERAPCTRVDPTGEAKLLYASETRHELRRLTRRGVLDSEKAELFLRRAKGALREAIYREKTLPTPSDLL